MMDNNTKMLLIIGVGVILFLLYNQKMMGGKTDDETVTDVQEQETVMNDINGVEDTTMLPSDVELTDVVEQLPKTTPPPTQADKVEGSNNETMYAEVDYTDTLVKPEDTVSQLEFDKNKVNPTDLLPSYKNLKSDLLDDINIGELHDNYLTAKPEALIGVNTVGSSNKNPNYGIRSEPSNPRTSVSPWNVSTITPDLHRRPLEIGCDGN